MLDNYRIFLDNVNMNNLKNIISYNMAVSKQDGNVLIYLNDDKSGHSMFLKSPNSIEVESISLKNIFDSNNIDKCDLLKIDCEGSEYEIIDSLPSNYFDKIDKMIIEYHFAEKYPKLVKNLIKKLESAPYSVNVKKLTNDTGLIFAIKNR